MTESIRAVERVLDILLCFTPQSSALTMTEISEKVGMHKSTVHRFLATLERMRFLQRDPSSGIYTPGIRMLQFAYLTLEHNDLRRIAQPFMHRLIEQHNETVDLSILDDAEMIFIDVIESPQRVKLAATIGQRLPAFCTAAGKAILSWLPEQTTRRIIEKGLRVYTPATIVDSDLLMENFRRARSLGYVISEQEYEDGINAIAVPILNSNDHPVAALAVAGPSFRLTREKMNGLALDLLNTARLISEQLPYSIT